MRLAHLAVLCVLAACSAESAVSRAVGARCDRKADCDERCLTDGDGFPGGFCSLSCLEPADCPDGARCADRAGGVCLFPCAADDDCAFLGAGPWRCVDADEPAGGDPVKVCAGD